MRYRHVVFDIDGTLIDTNGPYLLAMQRLLRERFGQEKSLRELTGILGIPERVTLGRMGFADVEEAFEALGRYYDEISGGIRVFDGLEETLGQLRDLGLSLGLVTSKTRKAFEEGFSRLPIAAFFDVAVCSEDTLRHKPDPEPMLRYLSLTGALPSQVLYVGDSPYDMSMCRASGTDAALATWGVQRDDVIPCTYLIRSPAEIPALLGL
ncbi:MAG: HAD family hydrolase [Oscillospiraceae bacterium]|nr:HAD family hydrolase [Oscillospiraceae bacterium]